jgi:hypothetical protein
MNSLPATPSISEVAAASAANEASDARACSETRASNDATMAAQIARQVAEGTDAASMAALAPKPSLDARRMALDPERQDVTRENSGRVQHKVGGE